LIGSNKEWKNNEGLGLSETALRQMPGDSSPRAGDGDMRQLEA
jgi:hypothetical protein